MTFPEFDEFFDALIAECRGMRDTKGKEYAHSISRFANFDRAAERLGISREMVANVYLHKHLDAIDSYILRKESYSGENIRGRIVDAITYLTLLAGMIKGAPVPYEVLEISYFIKPGEFIKYIGPNRTYLETGNIYEIVELIKCAGELQAGLKVLHTMQFTVQFTSLYQIQKAT